MSTESDSNSITQPRKSWRSGPVLNGVRVGVGSREMIMAVPWPAYIVAHPEIGELGSISWADVRGPQIEVMVGAIHAAIYRNYPEFTLGMLKEELDCRQFQIAWFALIRLLRLTLLYSDLGCLN